MVLGDYTEGTDFTCDPSAGTCSANAGAFTAMGAFANLQTQANRFASSAVGIAPVAVDGILGPQTLQAVQTILQSLNAAVPAPGTVDQLAAQAGSYAQELQNLYAIYASAPSPQSPSSSASKVNAPSRPGTTSSSASTFPWPWILGGVGIVVVGGAAFLVAKHRKDQGRAPMSYKGRRSGSARRRRAA